MSIGNATLDALIDALAELKAKEDLNVLIDAIEHYINHYTVIIPELSTAAANAADTILGILGTHLAADKTIPTASSIFNDAGFPAAVKTIYINRIEDYIINSGGFEAVLDATCKNQLGVLNPEVE